MSTSQDQLDVSDDVSILTVKAVPSNEEAVPTGGGIPAFGLGAEVEQGLFSSIVYLRADGRHSLSSLLSSSGAGSKYGWSFFSNFSLAQISNLSVISLPISCQELWDPRQYAILDQTDRHRAFDQLQVPIKSTIPASREGSSPATRRSSSNHLPESQLPAIYETAEPRGTNCSMHLNDELRTTSQGSRVTFALLGQRPSPSTIASNLVLKTLQVPVVQASQL